MIPVVLQPREREMAVTLKRQKDNLTWRPFWYGVYNVDGKRKVVNLGLKWHGSPPGSGSLRDLGDAAFEHSREKAEAELVRFRNEAGRKGRATHLVERLIEEKTGHRVEHVTLDEILDRWLKDGRDRPVSKGYQVVCKEVNRLRNFWPKTITIRYSDEDEDEATSGTSWIPSGKASFCNKQETCSLSLDLEPAFCDEAFIHPDDDKAFYESIALTQADRDKIAKEDREQACNFTKEAPLQIDQPTTRKHARNWSQHEPYSKQSQRDFAKLWNACRISIKKSPRARDFLDMYRKKLAEKNIRTEDDIKRIRNQAKGNHLMGKWNRFRANKKKRRY